MTTQLRETTKLPEIVPTPRAQAPYFIRIESESQAEIYYEIRYDFEHRCWSCDCPDAQGSRHNPRCKHWRAAMRLLDERRAANATKKAEAEAQAIAELHEEIDRVRCSAAQAAHAAQDELDELRTELDTVKRQAFTLIEQAQDELDELRDELAKTRAELETKATKRAPRTGAQSTKEQREKAPLNGNHGFSLMK